MEHEKRKRRAKVPFAEKLADIDERIHRKEVELADLRQQRVDMVAAHRRAAQEMLDEVGPA